MNPVYRRAMELREDLLRGRGALHSFAEIGFDLPRTTEHVMGRLREFGLSPQRMGRAGVVCTIGHGGRTLLLRADMDALPMREKTGLPFAAVNGNCHACGHDCHTAMLLTAARLLTEYENELYGTVKLMFQPAEEQLAGAADMVQAGVLENPRVDAGIGLHLFVGCDHTEVGELTYARGPAAYSGDAVRIRVSGKDAHGSTPELGVDAINIAAHIVIALQEIVAREIPCTDQSVLIVGKISGGTACNTLAGTAELECSIRATTPESRAYLKERLQQVAEITARTFRGTAQVDFTYGMPPMVNDAIFTDEIIGYAADIVPREKISIVPTTGGSEDFAVIAEKIPTAYLRLGAGSAAQGHLYTMHHPGMLVDEGVLPTGAALYAHTALCWLKAHRTD